MDFKIIETGSEYPDVLVHRDIDERGECFVEIKAFGKIDCGESGIATESVKFENEDAAWHFIRTFDDASASAFCKRQKVKY